MSQYLFLVALAALPIQLNKFFFLDFSFVLGIPIDYLALSIYASDIAIIAYILFFLKENGRKIKKIYTARKIPIIIFLIFNLYLFLTSIFVSKSPPVSLWFSLKSLEFSIFTILASITLDKARVRKWAVLVLLISISWQSAVIILEFIFQKSLGLAFLGERSFDSSTTSIAHSQIFGSQFLRPYGTFPHPNVAAAYLIVSLIIIVMSQKTIKFPKIPLAAASIIALVLAFSKSALLALFLAQFAIIKSARLLIIGIIISIIAGVIIGHLNDSELASISERFILSQAALDIALKNPLFGVGSGNFILEAAKLNLTALSETRLLQPVHNLFLLILAENGVFGLLIFSALLLTVAGYINSKIKFALFIVLLIFASFDHFLLTLQQGRFIFALITAFILTSPQSKSTSHSTI